MKLCILRHVDDEEFHNLHIRNVSEDKWADIIIIMKMPMVLIEAELRHLNNPIQGHVSAKWREMRRVGGGGDGRRNQQLLVAIKRAGTSRQPLPIFISATEIQFFVPAPSFNARSEFSSSSSSFDEFLRIFQGVRGDHDDDDD